MKHLFRRFTHQSLAGSGYSTCFTHLDAIVRNLHHSGLSDHILAYRTIKGSTTLTLPIGKRSRNAIGTAQHICNIDVPAGFLSVIKCQRFGRIIGWLRASSSCRKISKEVAAYLRPVWAAVAGGGGSKNSVSIAKHWRFTLKIDLLRMD